MPYINKGNTPNTDKLIYVSGLPGMPGTQGESGPQGPQGPAGVGTEITSTDITVSTNNSTLTSGGLSLSYLVNIASPADRNIAGVDSIITPGGQFPTKQITNTGAFNITFLHQSGLAVGQDRVDCPGGVDYILYPNKTAYLAYDYTAQNWVLTQDSSVVSFNSDTTVVTNNSTIASGSLAYSALVNISSASDVDCIGITASTVPGDMFPVKTIKNTGAFTINFVHQSGTAAATNRVITANSTTFPLKPNTSVQSTYDYTLQRWKLSEVATLGLQVIELSSTPGITNGEVRACNGYSSVGDGGGGQFEWRAGDTTTPVTGRIVSAASGRWHRIDPNVKALYVTDLFTRRGAYDGERVWTSGYYGITNGSAGLVGYGDGGGGEFIWHAASTLTMDGGYVVGPGSIGPDGSGYGAFIPTPGAPAGRWIRNIDNTTYRNVKHFGAEMIGYANRAPNSIIADYNAFMAAFNSSRPYGCRVTVPEGYLTLDKAPRLTGGGTHAITNCHIKGENCQGGTHNSSVIRWVGPPYWNGPTPSGTKTGSAILCLGNIESLVEGIAFVVMPGFHAEVALNIGYHPSDTVANTVTHHRVKNCSFSGGQAAVDTGGGQGSLSYGVAFDYFEKQAANIENCTVDDCTFSNIRHSDILIAYNCQPYNTTISNCYRISTLNSTDPGIAPYGTFVRNESASGSACIENCDVQRCACVVYMVQPFQSLTIKSVHAEQYKKLLYGLFGSSQTMGAITWTGGRLDPGGVDMVSEGPDVAWLATDYETVLVGGTQPISLKGLNLTRGFNEFTTFFFAIEGNQLTVQDCDLPHIAPFAPNGSTVPTLVNGSIKCFGCRAPGMTGSPAEGQRVAVPELRGCRTSGGTVTFTDAATTVAITHKHPDGSTNWPEAELGYKVRWCGATAITGTPAAGEPFAASITVNGFTATRTVAAGVGNSVTYAYELYRG